MLFVSGKISEIYLLARLRMEYLFGQCIDSSLIYLGQFIGIFNLGLDV